MMYAVKMNGQFLGLPDNTPYDDKDRAYRVKNKEDAELQVAFIKENRDYLPSLKDGDTPTVVEVC